MSTVQPPQRFGETVLAAKLGIVAGTTAAPVARVSGILSPAPPVVQSRIRGPNVSSGAAMNPEQMARALRVVQGNAEDVRRAARNAHDYGAIIIRGCAFPAVPQTQGNVSTVTVSGITLAGYLVESLALLSGFCIGGTYGTTAVSVTATWVLPTVSATVSPGSFDLKYWGR